MQCDDRLVLSLVDYFTFWHSQYKSWLCAHVCVSFHFYIIEDVLKLLYHAQSESGEYCKHFFFMNSAAHVCALLGAGHQVLPALCGDTQRRADQQCHQGERPSLDVCSAGQW